MTPMNHLRQAQLVDLSREPEEAPLRQRSFKFIRSIDTLMLESLSFEHQPITDSTIHLLPSIHLTTVTRSSTYSCFTYPYTTRALFHHRTARMTMRVQPIMSPGHSARVTEAMTLSDSASYKRYRSSYDTPSSSSSSALPVRKRYRGTSELILDTDSEGDELGEEDTEEDEEDESLDADYERERLDDEGHRLDDEGHGLEGEGLGLEEEVGVAPEGQQQAVLVVDTAASEPLGLGYGAARRRALESVEEIAPSTYEVGQSSRSMPKQHGADKSSGSLPISPSSHVVPSPIASPVATPTTTISVDEVQFLEVGAQLELYGSILQDHIQHLDAPPPTLIADIDRDERQIYTRSGVVRDDIFSQRYMFRSLERELERTVVMFEAL
ncbi:hypothetical protein Tco_0260229 [Tanacetum coccineum]